MFSRTTILTTFLTVALATFTKLHATAQAAWEAPLLAQIERVKQLSDDESLAPVAQTVERIAAANPTALWPNYYAAHYNLLLHWTSGDKGCAACVERADALINIAEKLAPNDSEIMTLRARYYQAMLGLHPMRAPFYGPKATNLLEAAVKRDPTNPRAQATLGSNLYYTPSMFGGGAEAARPHLQKAEELYAVEATHHIRANYLPNWGRGMNSSMLAKTTATVAEQ